MSTYIPSISDLQHQIENKIQQEMDYKITMPGYDMMLEPIIESLAKAIAQSILPLIQSIEADKIALKQEITILHQEIKMLKAKDKNK